MVTDLHIRRLRRCDQLGLPKGRAAVIGLQGHPGPPLHLASVHTEAEAPPFPPKNSRFPVNCP